MVHDITERKAAEQALREARDDLEQRVKWKTAELRSLIETLLRTEAYLAEAQRLSHTGSWALDVASGKYLYVSEEFSRIFGLDAQEGLPSREDFSRRIHPEDWDRANGSFEKQLGEKADITIEYRIALPNGTAKHIQAIRHPVLNDAGDVVQLVGTVIDITERRRTEEALRLASAYNRSLIEASLDPLVTIDPEGRISDVNAATELVTGFSRQELIGTDFADYFTDPEKARQGYERVFAEESVRDYPLEFRNRNGEITPVLYNASVYRDDTGNVLGVFAAARDITEQKRAEEARSRLAAIVESSDDAIISKDLDGTITSWNEGAERLYGYSASEALGRPISILMPPEQQDESIVLMRRIREGTRIDHYDTKRIRKDGGTIDVSLTLSPIRDHRGEIIGASAIARDISAQKRAEEALRLSEAYLAESQKLAHTGSWARDAKTLKAIYWSEELFRIYGFDPQQGFPMRNQMLERMHPEDRDKFNLFDRVLHEKVDCEAEYRIALPDGTVKHVHAIAHPVLTANGEVVQVVGTLMDITERKQAQEALQNLLADLESRVEERTKELSEANQSLEAANKELESFSYSVSHDLRAPLRAIDGFSRMVLKGYADKLDDEGRRKLNVIRSNAQQMDQLINDLLALSRMGRKEMAQASLDMEALVQSAWKELTLVNPERRIELSMQKLPPAMGDQTLVKEVLVNLLSNAIKFTKYREKAIVEVGAYPEGQTNVCFVKDNGVGFDMQYYDKLFGVFQRLHSADEFEGTGVGLAIVERIIHRHGGRVWAEGKVGEGAAFYFALPRKE